MSNKPPFLGFGLGLRPQHYSEILEGSPTSVRVSLRIMEETRGIPDVIEAVSYPSPALDDLMASEDSLEGVLAFAQKRKPQWRNR